jgi:AraC-like DNA-binding protein/HAMP domain-containing protein
VVLLLTLIALFAQKKINEQLSQMTETTIVTNDILNASLSVPFAISQYDMVRLHIYRKQIDHSVTVIKKKLGYLNSTIHDQYGIAQLAILNGYFISFFDCIRETEDYLARGGKDNSTYIDQINKQLDSIQIYTQQLNMAELHYYGKLKNGLDYRIFRIWLYSIYSFIFGGICLCVVFYYLNKTTNAVVNISRLAQNVADGDLSVRSVDSKSDDEISVLAQSFNKMVENLRDFQDSQPLLREQFFRKLADRKVAASALPAYLNNLQLKIEGYLTAVIIQLDDYYLVTFHLTDEERANFRNEFSQAIGAVLKDNPEIFKYEYNPGEFVLCVTGGFSSDDSSDFGLLINKIRSGLDQKYSVTIAVGNSKNSILSFADSYDEAFKALSHKFILGMNRNIFYKDLERKSQQQAFPSLVSYETELIKAIKLSAPKLIEEKLNIFIEEIKGREGDAPLFLKMIISNLYLQALQTIQQSNIEIEEVFDDPLPIYQKIISHQTIDGMGRELLEVLINIADFINIKKGQKFYQMIAKAQEYILQNYGRGDLSLEEVANVVHVSGCYFSLIFKREVGMTFIDYLVKVRIEKAKELLAIPGNLSYEVAYQVGYNNPTYFSRTFKKHTGISPTEFKNQYTKK